MEFAARRPFHPMRLHSAVDALLDGVVRTRGRAWLASQPNNVIWIESAGGGLHVANAGAWLAAMNPSHSAYADRERQAIASTHWDARHGDRHVSMTILVCGPSRCNSRSIAECVMETQPAVGPKFFRARCRKTALPRPGTHGIVL